MKPIRHIRKNVFGVNQTEFADMLGTTQAAVSRMERGAEITDKRMMMIRELAKERRLKLKDTMFFETPDDVQAAE